MPWILVHTKSYVHPPRVESLFPPVLWNCCTQALHACMHTCVLNHFSHVQLFVTPWTTAHQAPLSMGFSRQEYWNGLLCPPPGDLPNQGPNSGLPQCWWILYCLSHQGCPRILEYRVAYPFSMGSSRPRNRIRVSCIAGRFFDS